MGMIGTATLGLSAGDVFCGARALSHGFRNAGCDVTTSVLAEHDAEWVTDGVGEDSKARLTLTVHARGAECEQLLLGLVGIADANVEVQLLRMGPGLASAAGSICRPAGKPAAAGRAQRR
jgi:hypothetical protein